jgi:hypothetical protein
LIKGHGSTRSTRGLIVGLGFSICSIICLCSSNKASCSFGWIQGRQDILCQYYLVEHYLEEERLASFLKNLVDGDAVLHPTSLGATKETGPTQRTNGRGNGTKYGTGRIDRVEAAHKIAQNVFKGRRWKEKKAELPSSCS